MLYQISVIYEERNPRESIEVFVWFHIISQIVEGYKNIKMFLLRLSSQYSPRTHTHTHTRTHPHTHAHTRAHTDTHTRTYRTCEHPSGAYIVYTALRLVDALVSALAFWGWWGSFFRCRFCSRSRSRYCSCLRSLLAFALILTLAGFLSR